MESEGCSLWGRQSVSDLQWVLGQLRHTAPCRPRPDPAAAQPESGARSGRRGLDRVTTRPVGRSVGMRRQRARLTVEPARR